MLEDAHSFLIRIWMMRKSIKNITVCRVTVRAASENRLPCFTNKGNGAIIKVRDEVFPRAT